MNKKKRQLDHALLESWRPPHDAGDPVGCLTTTFTFDAGFFEEECLARFLEIDSLPDREGLAYLLERENRLGPVYAGVLGAFALFVLASGDFLLVLVFGAKYGGYGAVIGVLALSMLAQSMGVTAGIGLWAIDHPKANLAADVCALVITLTVMFCLLQSLGALGAALGDLAGKVSGGLVRYGTLRALLKTTLAPAEIR